MPVRMAVDILENADISVFVGQGGAVECDLEDLKHPGCAVYFLKGNLCQTMVARNVWDKVHCKTLELPLNFHQVMVRYQFRTPPKGDLSREEWLNKCSRYITMWIDLIIAEKRRQMHAPNEMWPRWMPWEAKTVWNMPIVLWLSKPRDRKRVSSQ